MKAAQSSETMVFNPHGTMQKNPKNYEFYINRRENLKSSNRSLFQ